MELFLMIGCLLVQGFSVGGASLLQKKAQDGRLYSVMDSLVFITLLSAFQVITYLIIPPYQAFPTDFSFYGHTTCFSVFFIIQIILYIRALSMGPTSITATFKCLYMVVPIIIGLFLWNETFTWRKGIGMAIFIAAMIFMNGGSYSVAGKSSKLSVKWLILCILLLIFSGTDSAISKQVMMTHENVNKVYLLLYNLIVVVIGIPICIIYRKKTLQLFKDKTFMLTTLGASVLTVIFDSIFVYLVPKFDTAFYLPLSGTLSILAGIILSRIFLKEKISPRSIISVVLCIVAVIILS